MAAIFKSSLQNLSPLPTSHYQPTFCLLITFQPIDKGTYVVYEVSLLILPTYLLVLVLFIDIEIFIDSS